MRRPIVQGGCASWPGEPAAGSWTSHSREACWRRSWTCLAMAWLPAAHAWSSRPAQGAQATSYWRCCTLPSVHGTGSFSLPSTTGAFSAAHLHAFPLVWFRFPPAFPPPVWEAIMRIERDVLRWTCNSEGAPGSGRGPDMSRNSMRLLLLVATTLFFSSAFPNPALAQSVSFIARGDFAAGTHPQAVAVGDFNGDGRPDLAVANSGSSAVSVLLGNGDGTFQTARTFTAGSGPQTVAVGDVNGDGRPDLAVANSGSNTVSVLLGNGDGTFQAARTFAAGTTPSSVALGDVNGDGRPDLAEANPRSIYHGHIHDFVLFGNHNGT